MKWKTPLEVMRPKAGAVRYRTAFAIFPHQASNGYTYWLEKVLILERYIIGYVRGRSCWYIAEWIGNKAPEGEENS